MNYKKRAWRPRVHLHLLGIHFHSCKPHPASVWLIPLWSISGRHHRYCWSPHCTAKQFQILSVGIEKNIDILPSRAITQTMNILILFSQRAICAPRSTGLVLGELVLPDIVKPQCKDFFFQFSVSTLRNQRCTKVQAVVPESLTLRTEMTTVSQIKEAQTLQFTLFLFLCR